LVFFRNKKGTREMIIKPEQFFQEMADILNKKLAETPDDETRQAVLDSFSKQMFCDTRKAQEK
jgi:hypothetical protein